MDIEKPFTLYRLCLDFVARSGMNVGKDKIADVHHYDIIAYRHQLLRDELRTRVPESDGTFQGGWLQKLTPEQKEFHCTTYDWDCIENREFCEQCGKYKARKPELQRHSSGMLTYVVFFELCDRCDRCARKAQ